MKKVGFSFGGDEPKCGIQPSPIPIVDNPKALSSHARGWQHRGSAPALRSGTLRPRHVLACPGDRQGRLARVLVSLLAWRHIGDGGDD